MKKHHKKEEVICEHKTRVSKDGNWYGFGRASHAATLSRLIRVIAVKGLVVAMPVLSVSVASAGRVLLHWFSDSNG